MPADAQAPVSPREEAFGYRCQRCLRCCHHKRIQLNPYEVARLARRVGRTTTEFRTAFTQEGAGNALEQTATGACVFLGPEGCTVHPDRPLVCRLYPLGRHVLGTGEESFSHVALHPQSEGTLTRDGTIAQYLIDQGAEPFMRAADAYFYWYCRATERLQALSGQLAEDRTDDAGDAATAAFRLLDMDVAIAEHCHAHGIEAPEDIEARRTLHLQILDRQLDSLVSENSES